MRRIPYDPEARRDLARVAVAYHSAELVRATIELDYPEAAVVPVTLQELPADVLKLIAAVDQEVFGILRRTCRRLARLLLYDCVFVNWKNFEAVMTSPRTYLQPKWILHMCWSSHLRYSDDQAADWLAAAAPTVLHLSYSNFSLPSGHKVKASPVAPALLPARIARLHLDSDVVTDNLFRIIDRDRVHRLVASKPAQLLFNDKQAFTNLTYLRLKTVYLSGLSGSPELRFKKPLQIDLKSTWYLLYAFNVRDSTLIVAPEIMEPPELCRLTLRFQSVWARVAPAAVARFLAMFEQPPELHGNKYKLFK